MNAIFSLETRPKKQKDIRSIVSILAIVFLSLFLTIFIEAVHRESLSDAFNWAVSNNIHFLFNYLIVLSVLGFISALIGCVYTGLSLSGIALMFLTLANVYKIKFRGDPLFPWDLMLRGESTNMFQYVTDKSDIRKLVFIFLSIILLAFLRFLLPKLGLSIKYRITVLILAFFLLYSFGYKQSLLGIRVYSINNIKNSNSQQGQSYLENGFILAFSLNIKNSIIPQPKDYTRSHIEKVAVEHINDWDTHLANNKKPNLIIIMNEAFWDPTVMENIKFNKDPIPFFRSLHDKYTSGWIRSPQYGGGTSNIEFEVMTGHSMNFLPPGSMAFQKYLGSPIMSLASILNQQGYESIGIHSYDGWFWNRTEAYKNMGFNKFVSIEYFTDLRYEGWYISDDVVTDMIIDELESSEKPLFIYAVTMQNHGPYDNNRYSENTIKVEGPITDESKLILETFSQGLVDADKSLEKLIQHLETSDEPSIVVFFGDHLPMLGRRYSVYTEAGYIQSSDTSLWTFEETLNMKKVPFIIWSNYKQDKQNLGTINTSFLGAYLLQYMNKEIPKYFSFINSIRGILPVIGEGFALTTDNNFISEESDLYGKIIRQYELMQYDQFFGKNYLDKDNEDRWIIKENPSYNSTINNISITNAVIQNDYIVIEGSNFVPSLVVLINGRELNPEFVSVNRLKLSLKDNNINTNNQIKLQLRLNNSKGITLTQSMEYNLQ